MGQMIQLDMFIQEKKDLEEQLKREKEDSIRSQLRLLHHAQGSMVKRMDKQEALMEKIVEFLLDK